MQLTLSFGERFFIHRHPAYQAVVSFRLKALISHAGQLQSAAAGNHSIFALSNDRQLAASGLAYALVRQLPAFNPVRLADSPDKALLKDSVAPHFSGSRYWFQAYQDECLSSCWPGRRSARLWLL
nr:MAG TPA: hypothetical protein [Caudoviricetes sp.]